MNNLVPVVRNDKNGKSTTRWVKGDSSASAPITPLPAPVPFTWDVEKEKALRWSDAMSKVSPRAAALLEDALNRLSSNKTEQDALRFDVESYVEHHEPHVVDNLAFFCDVLCFDGHRTPIECFEGLKKYDGFETIHNYLTDATPRKQVQARSLIYAVSHLDGFVEWNGGHDYGADSSYDDDSPDNGYTEQTAYYEPDSYAIYDAELVRLLIDHPDKAEDIVLLAEDGESKTMDIIRAQVTLPEKALREGAL